MRYAFWGVCTQWWGLNRTVTAATCGRCFCSSAPRPSLPRREAIRVFDSVRECLYTPEQRARMYEYVCARERMCLGELSGRAQRAEKTCAHDTSQPQYTMEERERACTPAALTMIPRSLPRSLAPAPSLGSHQDSDDLMMRETTLIIHTQQTSPLAVLLSHTGVHEPQICTGAHTYSHSEMHKYSNVGLAHVHSASTCNSHACTQTNPK